MIDVRYKEPCHAIHVTGKNNDAVCSVLENADYMWYMFSDRDDIMFYRDESLHFPVKVGDWLVVDPQFGTVVVYNPEEFEDTFYRNVSVLY
jgi:hypothetical protein